VDIEQVQALAKHAIDEFESPGYLGKQCWNWSADRTHNTYPAQAYERSNRHQHKRRPQWFLDSNAAFLATRHRQINQISGRGEKSPIPNFNPYGASKSWIYSYTIALAKEYRDSGVGVFLFQPGLVRSDMMGHMYFIEGYDEELLKIFKVIARLFSLPPDLPARKAVWLASAATDGKTGLHVNLLGPRHDD